MNTMLGVAVGDRKKVLGDEFVDAIKEKFEEMVIEGLQSAIVIAVAEGGCSTDVIVIYRLYVIRGVMEHCTIMPDTQEAKAIIAIAEDVLDEIMEADRRGESSCSACMRKEEDDEPPTLH